MWRLFGCSIFASMAFHVFQDSDNTGLMRQMLLVFVPCFHNCPTPIYLLPVVRKNKPKPNKKPTTQNNNTTNLYLVCGKREYKNATVEETTYKEQLAYGKKQIQL